MRQFAKHQINNISIFISGFFWYFSGPEMSPVPPGPAQLTSCSIMFKGFKMYSINKKKYLELQTASLKPVLVEKEKVEPEPK